MIKYHEIDRHSGALLCGIVRIERSANYHDPHGLTQPCQSIRSHQHHSGSFTR